nr:nucleolar protein 10 [Cryptomonas curvata]
MTKMYAKATENLSNQKIINSIFNFNFPSLVKKIKQTNDNSYLIAYGEYPPQIRCFDLYNLSLKFQRTINCEINDFEIISQNWEKLILLRSDKFLEFHSKSGYYYQVKIPDIANSLFFDNLSKILYIFSINNEIYRFNVEEGKFISSILSNLDYYNTSSAKSLLGDCLGLGNSRGLVELWDFKFSKKPVSTIDGLIYLKKKKKNYVSYLNFCEKATYKIYSGYSSGDIIIFDLRNLSPIISKKIGINDSIIKIQNNQINNLILSANKQIIKLWNEKSGNTIITLDQTKKINDICPVKNTGFIFISTIDPHVNCIYVPLLGPPPVWCYNLNNKKSKNFKKIFIPSKIAENYDKKIKINTCLDKLINYI